MNEHKKNTERQINDFYATDPSCVEDICKILDIQKDDTILDPCAGMGHMAKVLKKYSNFVVTNEKFEYEYETNFKNDFLELNYHLKFDYLIMNPPFKYAHEFIDRAFGFSNTVVVFQKLSFLEGIRRYDDFYKWGRLKEVHVYPFRVVCAKDGDFENTVNSVAYAWYVFDINGGHETKLKWIERDGE